MGDEFRYDGQTAGPTRAESEGKGREGKGREGREGEREGVNGRRRRRHGSVFYVFFGLFNIYLPMYE